MRGQPTYIKLTLRSRIPKDELPISAVVQQSTKKNTKDVGLAYRIPAPANVAIFAGADESMEQDISIAQYGSVVHLPANLGGDATIDFTLDPATSNRKRTQEQLRLLLIQKCVANPDRPGCPALVGQQ